MSVYWPFRVGVQGTPAMFFSFIYVLTTVLNPFSTRTDATRRDRGGLTPPLTFRHDAATRGVHPSSSFPFNATQRGGFDPPRHSLFDMTQRRGPAPPRPFLTTQHNRETQRGGMPLLVVPFLSTQIHATRRGTPLHVRVYAHRHDFLSTQSR